MRLWVGETAGKRELLDFLSDSFEKKPIAICEVRQIANAALRNFTVANDPHSAKFKNALAPIKAAVKALIKVLPSNVLVLDDWYNEDDMDAVDYFVMHKPEDADALLRLSKVDADIAKAHTRAVEAWGDIRRLAPDRLLLLGYDERLRDILSINAEGTLGVELSFTTTAVADHKAKVNVGDDDRLAYLRVMGGKFDERKEVSERVGTREGPGEPRGGNEAGGEPPPPVPALSPRGVRSVALDLAGRTDRVPAQDAGADTPRQSGPRRLDDRGRRRPRVDAS